MSSTKIEWTDATWNCATGCTKVSAGCKNCYAEGVANRFFASKYPAVDGRPRRFTDVMVHAERLEQPLRWRPKRIKCAYCDGTKVWYDEPCSDCEAKGYTTRSLRIFVNSMSDLFHEDIPFEFVAAVFGVMAACPQHTFQILTKRPERALELFAWLGEQGKTSEPLLGLPGRSVVLAYAFEAFKIGHAVTTAAQKIHHARLYTRKADNAWPLLNVWLGVSVEDQSTADARIPLLLQTPAALRFVSYEPALAAVDFTRLRGPERDYRNALDSKRRPGGGACIDWVIVGGESGPGARPFDAQWARDTITQCAAADVPCFVKQLGAKPFEWETVPSKISKYGWGKREEPLNLASSKGGDMADWPEDLRVREFPIVTTAAP